MKKQLILIVILCFTLLNCNSSKRQEVDTKDFIVSPKMEEILDAYIKENSNEDGGKLYALYFYNKNNEQYVEIFQAYNYDKRYVSVYSFKNKELVIIYFLDIVKGMNIIEEKNLIKFKDSIPNYEEVSQSNVFYETYPRKYKIISPDSLELIPE